MGRPTEQLENRTQINQLKNHHKSMARDIIVQGNIRNVDLARIYNMRESQISIVINSPCFIAYLAELETKVEDNICDVREDIRLMTPRAAQVIRQELYVEPKENINGEIIPLPLADRKLRLQVALEVMDRDSGKKKHGESAAKELHFHNHQEIHLTKNMSTQDLQRDIFDLIDDGEDD